MQVFPMLIGLVLGCVAGDAPGRVAMLEQRCGAATSTPACDPLQNAEDIAGATVDGVIINSALADAKPFVVWADSTTYGDMYFQISTIDTGVLNLTTDDPVVVTDITGYVISLTCGPDEGELEVTVDGGADNVTKFIVHTDANLAVPLECKCVMMNAAPSHHIRDCSPQNCNDRDDCRARNDNDEGSWFCEWVTRVAEP